MFHGIYYEGLEVERLCRCVACTSLCVWCGGGGVDDLA